jgi:hypothetical protein
MTTKHYSKVDTRRIEGSFESILQQLTFDLIAKMSAEFEEQRTAKDYQSITATSEAKSEGGHVFNVAITFEPKVEELLDCQHCKGTGRIKGTNLGIESEGNCCFCIGTGKVYRLGSR